MILPQNTLDIPALHYPRWIFITLQTDGDFYNNFHQKLYPFLAESIAKKDIEHYIFIQEVNKVLLLFLKTTPFQNTSIIKPRIEALYDDHIVNYLDFYLFNFEIPQNPIIEELLTMSSQLLTDYILENKNECNEDVIFPYALQMHLIFTYTMGMRRIEMKEFYNYTFHNSLLFAFNNQSEQSSQLISELSSNFEHQKSDLVAYIDYIYSQLEENELEEHKSWYNICQRASDEIKTLYNLKRFKQDNNFQYDKSLTSSKALQEKWKLFEQCIYFIDGQLTNIYNLQYILKESIAYQN